MFPNIEDYSNNETRFAVIGHADSGKTGNDKTALVFQVPHTPGALADVLAVFKANKINLTWIESFPYRRRRASTCSSWTSKATARTPKVKKTLQSLEKYCDTVSMLGSFPMAKVAE